VVRMKAGGERQPLGDGGPASGRSVRHGRGSADPAAARNPTGGLVLDQAAAGAPCPALSDRERGGRAFHGDGLHAHHHVAPPSIAMACRNQSTARVR
jgi:hypothetical protein